MRYTYEHESFFDIPEEERGNIIHISVMVGVDEFNYAIHAVESIMGFLGDVTPVSTRYLGTNTVGDVKCDSYYVLFENGVSACYHICKKGWQPSTALVMTSKTSFAYKIDSNKVYEAMLKQVCAYMAGKENKLATVKQITDSIKIMLAGKKSMANGGTVECIADLKESDPSFDGTAFEEFYAASQRK
jgi:predicted lipoprotein with Yx(FWY)xxD motif